MNRREFVQFLSLIAAGTAAKPEQIKAFEEYYDANTPRLANDLVAVDEIFIAGLAMVSTPAMCEFYKNDQIALNGGLNLFGGTHFWRAGPDSKIICNRSDFYWRFIPRGPSAFSMLSLHGHVSFINSQKYRETLRFSKLEGSLLDP